MGTRDRVASSRRVALSLSFKLVSLRIQAQAGTLHRIFTILFHKEGIMEDRTVQPASASEHGDYQMNRKWGTIAMLELKLMIVT